MELVDSFKSLCDRPLLPRPTGVAPRLTSLPDVRAVLFDVYGTLVVSASGDLGVAQETSEEHALRQALEASELAGDLEKASRRGARLLLERIEATHDELRHRAVAHPEVDIREVWAVVLATLRAEELVLGDASPQQIDRLAVEYECRVNPVWPMPCLEETLGKLRQRGLRLGIVSNAQFYTPLLFGAFLDQSLSDLGFDDELCEWSYVRRQAKPSTGLYERVAEELDRRHGVSPRQTLFVGNDMLNDIWAAAEVGFQTALFAADQRSLRLRREDPRCADLEPDVVLTDLAQVVGCVSTP